MAESSEVPCIYVIAGTNGAGKSSIAGAAIRERGGSYFNPDEAARALLSANPGLTREAANSTAWQMGKRLLERAIAEGLDFTFETTLGGNTIPRLLERAALAGHQVRVWYVGLGSLEQHLGRVRARVEKGGHDIPEAMVRKRFDAGRLNLIRLLPRLTELRLYDNSFEADPDQGKAPQVKLVLHFADRKILGPHNLDETPEWAKPIVAAAIKLAARA